MEMGLVVARRKDRVGGERWLGLWKKSGKDLYGDGDVLHLGWIRCHTAGRGGVLENHMAWKQSPCSGARQVPDGSKSG